MSESHASIVVPGARAGTVTEAWRLAWPTIVGNLAVTAMWTADTIFLGQVGKVELAAAGFGGVLIFTLYTFFIGVVNAVNTFVSQAKGAGKPEECGAFAWQGLWVSLAAAVLLMFAVWRFDLILAIAGPAADVAAECVRYSRVRLASAFFVLGTFTLQAFFRGVGAGPLPGVRRHSDGSGRGLAGGRRHRGAHGNLHRLVLAGLHPPGAALRLPAGLGHAGRLVGWCHPLHAGVGVAACALGAWAVEGAGDLEI